MKKTILLCLLLLASISACNLEDTAEETAPTPTTSTNNGGSTINGQAARVTNVIDGDTIDVQINGETFRVRYVGVNTPERDEPCYTEAGAANRALVGGQNVILVRDVSETDRFDRLLRYVYVGDIFVNELLVAQGFAEAVLYNPDNREHDNFVQLEQQATQQNLGCHPSGIFNDDSTTR
ncbi:MAG: thermonuclease family protein [Aggregatilineales bacterium]